MLKDLMKGKKNKYENMVINKVNIENLINLGEEILEEIILNIKISIKNNEQVLCKYNLQYFNKCKKALKIIKNNK